MDGSLRGGMDARKSEVRQELPGRILGETGARVVHFVPFALSHSERLMLLVFYRFVSALSYAFVRTPARTHKNEHAY